MKIYKYQPIIVPGPAGTEYRLGWDSTEENPIDLCEIDGWRYISVPETLTVTVPEEITTWQLADITSELKEQIKANSSICQTIAQRVIDRIRAKYPLDEELYLARIAVGSLQGTYQLQPGESELLASYQADVEAAREWGRQERTKLGL